jgi:DNA modification methylase
VARQNKSQLDLIEDVNGFRAKTETKSRSGPPNRMNDLDYSTWMKFQKSFFRHESYRKEAEKCIHFFTKSKWPDGRVSRSLVAGFPDFEPEAIEKPRVVNTHPNISSVREAINIVRPNGNTEKQDFILVNLLDLIRNRSDLEYFLESDADDLFAALRERLHEDRYCGLVIGMEEKHGAGFPLPWSVALACRDHLRLRDEKVGLVEDDDFVYYELFMQANDDNKESVGFHPGSISILENNDVPKIPAWTIPRPRSRKYGEELHPAKFPETLVSEFISLFTSEGDYVLDPMAGTGSAVMASNRLGRNAIGVDLMEKYVNMANRRISASNSPTLFSEEREGKVVQGDATQLTEIEEVSEHEFQYAVTSPPYWSMLRNPGSENQKERRQRNLELKYSDSERDLGNIEEYETFCQMLKNVYDQVALKLEQGGILTVIVKNVKRDHVIYPLAWDLARTIAGENERFRYIGTTLWCQDNVGLKPFAVGIHWTSNILHQYCLHFQVR